MKLKTPTLNPKENNIKNKNTSSITNNGNVLQLSDGPGE